MTEDQIQKAIAKFYNQLMLFRSDFTFFAVPNEGKRQNGGSMVAKGMRAGVHDLVFLFDRARTFLIELKTLDGKISDDQKEFHAKAESLEHISTTIWAAHGHDAIDQINKFFLKQGIKLS